MSRRSPVVSLLILAANLAAAFLLFYQPDLIETYGFIPARPTVVAALASLFLHANLVHLLGNMVFLAAAGPAAESAVGSLRFFGVYLAAGLSGIAAHWALGPGPQTPLIGASGAVAGVVALASVRFFSVRVPLAPGLSVPIFAVSGLWLLLQIAGGFIQLGGAGEAVAYWAHIGGAAAGLLLALAFRTQKDAEFEASTKRLDDLASRSPAAALAAAEDHLRAHPRDFRAMAEKGAALAKLGESQQAARAFLDAADAAPRPNFAQVADAAVGSGCLNHLPSMKRAHWASRLTNDHAPIAEKLWASIVEGPNDDPQVPDAMLALAELRRGARPQEAKRLADDLIAAYPLHPAAEIARTKDWPG